ncbi:MAG: putative lysis protein [Alehxovirus pseudofaecicola]|uniref:Lysis protein n=1 Tax=Leviviridae sp. TaxID=2027243 RepID=A0ABY4DC92_9VIRU|nr:MAG: putative lysis protein [Leviviridae sp.]
MIVAACYSWWTQRRFASCARYTTWLRSFSFPARTQRPGNKSMSSSPLITESNHHPLTGIVTTSTATLLGISISGILALAIVFSLTVISMKSGASPVTPESSITILPTPSNGQQTQSRLESESSTPNSGETSMDLEQFPT